MPKDLSITVAELILSARILVCTEYELIWACRDNATCNCGESSLHTYKRPQDLSENALFGDGLETLGDGSFSEVWWELVRAYSGKELSRSSDKLAVLAGIARKLAPRDHNAYINGLWRHSLVRDLHWMRYVRTGTREIRDITKPSWSWASLAGVAVYNRQLSSFEKETVGIYKDLEILDTIPQGNFQNPWTSVTVLSISVRGFLVSIELDRHEPTADNHAWFSTSWEDYSYPWWPDVCPSEFLVEGQEKFNASLLITTKLGDLGLILSPVAGKPDTYRRLGLFDADDGHGSLLPEGGFVLEGAELSIINLV